MKNKIRKTTAICLVSAVIISSLVFAKATNNEIAPSKDLLEAILNERTWVLDTIVDGNYTTNPCGYLAGTDNFETYSNYVYGNFVNDKKMAILVRTADVLYNAGGYLADALINEKLEDLLELCDYYDVNISDENKDDLDYVVAALANVLDSFNKTREEKYYEYILSGVFTTDFTSPAQITVEQEEATLSELQTLSAQYGEIEGIIKDQKDLVKFGTSVTENIKYNYINDILPLYSYSVNEYLDSYSVVGNTTAYTQDMIDNKRNSFTDSLYTMSMLQKYDADEDSVKVWRSNIQGEGLLKKTNNVLKPLGETVSFVNSALNNYILIESLQEQRESSVGALDSLYNITDNSNLRNAVITYRNLINDEYDGLTSLYKTGIDTLTDGNLVYDAASKFLTKKVSNIILNHASVSTAKLVSKAASVLAAAKLTTFLTDVVTGVEETVKKVYQIEHALKMIDQMKLAYEQDLETYKSDKTEENAQVVLNDLMFIRKLRMFTCKLAYDSAANQLNSALGKLLTGFDEEISIKAWENMYQDQIEALLSATINPISKTPFTVNEGELLIIHIKENWGEYIVNGQTYAIGEVAERMMGGLIVNSGTVCLYGSEDEELSFYTSSITATGDSLIKAYNNSNLKVYALSHENGTLTLDFDGNLHITKSLDLNKTSYVFEGSGNLIVEGDLNLANTTISKVTLAGKSEQNICGSDANIDNLIFNNTSKEGVVVTGTINVTNSVSNAATKVKGGQKIVLKSGGSILGNYIHDDISVENFNYNKDIVFGGGLYVVGTLDVSVGTAQINGNFSSIGNAIVNIPSGSILKVKGDTYFKSGTLNFDGTYESGGDISLNESQSAYFKKLILNGSSPQNLNTTTVITVKELVNTNLSSGGVSVSGIWQISDSISSASAKITGGTNITLLGGSTIEGGKLNSGISVVDWSCDYDLDINGTLNISGETSFSEGLILDVLGSLNITDNTDFFDNMTINVGENLISNGTLSIGNNVTINVDGNLKQNGGTMVAGEVTEFNIKGNMIQNNGTFTATESTTIDIKSDYAASNSTLSFLGVFNVDGDAQFTDSVFESDGEATFHRDFAAESFTGYFNYLHFTSIVPQKISSNSPLSANYLKFSNLSAGGITIDCNINVAGNFENNSFRIVNREKILCGTYITEGMDGTVTVEGDFYLSQWDGEENLHITNNLIVNADKIIPAEKTVTVDGDLKITDGSVTVEKGANLNVRTNLIGTGGTIILNGEMTVEDDTSLNTVSIKGNGNLIICGDLYAENSTVNRPDVTLRSKIPQVISGSDINFNNVTVENTSASGVKLLTSIYYYGDLVNDSGSVISDSEKFVYKEEA